MDRRIEKTYTDLQASMRSLLGKTTWDKITIQALCSSAGISRSTFYAHFSDKEDLLDSLLQQFEVAMKNDRNGRSLRATGTLRFLPILVTHVSQNRHLFAKTNTQEEGYPVAARFRALIYRLTNDEFASLKKEKKLDATTVQFIAGGVYQSLVYWSKDSKDDTHLSLLRSIDTQVSALLSQ